MTNPLLLDVDVHRKSNTVSLADATGRWARQRFKADNNLPGIAAFVERVSSLAEEGCHDAIYIAAEATALVFLGWDKAMLSAGPSKASYTNGQP